jgi:hypothetical protein
LWARFRTHLHFLSHLCHIVLKWSGGALSIPRNSCQIPLSQNPSHITLVAFLSRFTAAHSNLTIVELLKVF